MNLGALTLKLYRYVWLDQSSATEVPEGILPIIVQAVNAARKWAEQDHDFDCNRQTVIGVVPANGGLLWKAALADKYDAEVDHKLKVVENVYLRHTNGDVPIRFMRKKGVAQDVLETPSYGVDESGSDLRDANECGRTLAYFHGDRMFLAPSNTVNVDVTLDGIVWSADYSDEDDEDWFLEHGHNFLFWQSVVELNHLTKQFVYRQEGNVMPPENQAKLAYQTLVKLDDYMIEGNANPDQD
jgi:hypothetical protein